MCKTQRDNEVAQQDERKKNKMRDTMKALHNQVGCQPPRSPISPSPLEVEIASVDDRVNAFLNSDLYNHYECNFGSDIGASSSSAPPLPPPTGFDSMFEGDTTAPPPWVPPPSTDWAARVSHEFFDQPATSYGMEISLVPISEIHPYIALLYPSFSCVCLVANPNTGDNTWDQWQQQ
jgi:hypothetical protein